MKPHLAETLAAFIGYNDFHRLPPTMSELALMRGRRRNTMRLHCHELVALGHLRHTPGAVRAWRLTPQARQWWRSGTVVVRCLSTVL